MQSDQLIQTKVFCESHHIELSFIRQLHESGLIEVTVIKENSFVHLEQLEHLERIVRLYYEMDINVEGIETITHLLKRMNSMQQEITALKNKLQMFEAG